MIKDLSIDEGHPKGKFMQGEELSQQMNKL